MRPPKPLPKSMRATFEDVLSAQEKLRKWIDSLIMTNGFIPADKREMFFRLLANATLGCGIRISADFTPADAERFNVFSAKKHIRVGNIEDLVRFLAYVTQQPKDRPMSHYWEKALSGLLIVYPISLQESVKISIERIPREPTEIHEI